jgi:hypothetical protein
VVIGSKDRPLLVKVHLEADELLAFFVTIRNFTGRGTSKLFVFTPVWFGKPAFREAGASCRMAQ